MRILEDTKLNLDDLVIVPQRSTGTSRNDVNLLRKFKFYHSPRELECVPIMCANMPTIATKAMAMALNKYSMITVLHKYYTIQQLKDIYRCINANNVWISIGFKDDDIEKIEELSAFLGYSPNIVIDVPNAYIEKFVVFCARVRERFPDSIIMGGNVCTGEMSQELIIHGKLDIVKIQIGVGSACRTRMVAGVGYGSASCIVECSSTVHGLKNGDKKLGLVCSDGGIKNICDAPKSTSLGSDFIMIGSLFGGTDECTDAEWGYGSEMIWNGNTNSIPYASGKKIKKYMKYYGLSTHYAQDKHEHIKKDYRASEGDILKIPYRGGVESVIQELLGGYRSACLYIGASSIKDMSKCAVLAKVNNIHPKFNSTNTQNGV